MAQGAFTWHDGEREVYFGEGAVGRATGALDSSGWGRFELLSTPRALDSCPRALVDAAATVHEVPQGPVTETAAALCDRVRAADLAALGGGRVIDTAKAIAAVNGGRVAAIPTTLSGAEMTRIHRLPEGRQAGPAGRVRPALVFADPLEMTTQPERALRASAMNALAHGADSLYTPLANPVSRMVALEGGRLIAAGLDGLLDEAGRGDLALGSILAAYALDSASFSLHHVICQTLVRVMRIPHAETNAAILPRALEALRDRGATGIPELAAALGTSPDAIGARIEELAGRRRTLAAIGADENLLDEALDAMLDRATELERTPNPPGREELRRLIESAW
ncbi:MAG: iron-containing alcohol dehydrogenase [Actinomycetota bacterium]|nr:iron-containing alcohol dehydrogenase [Actinomycetota bacterium]